MNAKTFTVVSSYVGRDKQPRAFIKGRDLPFLTDRLLSEGASVRIEGDRAVAVSQ